MLCINLQQLLFLPFFFNFFFLQYSLIFSFSFLIFKNLDFGTLLRDSITLLVLRLLKKLHHLKVRSLKSYKTICMYKLAVALFPSSFSNFFFLQYSLVFSFFFLSIQKLRFQYFVERFNYSISSQTFNETASFKSQIVGILQDYLQDHLHQVISILVLRTKLNP